MHFTQQYVQLHFNTCTVWSNVLTCSHQENLRWYLTVFLIFKLCLLLMVSIYSYSFTLKYLLFLLACIIHTLLAKN